MPAVSSGTAPSCIQNSRMVANDDDRGLQSDAARKAAERLITEMEEEYSIFESSRRQKLKATICEVVTHERTVLTWVEFGLNFFSNQIKLTELGSD